MEDLDPELTSCETGRVAHANHVASRGCRVADCLIGVRQFRTLVGVPHPRATLSSYARDAVTLGAFVSGPRGQRVLAIGDWEYWLQPPPSRHTLWFDDAEQQLADRGAIVSLRALSGSFEATCDDTSPEAIASGRQVAIVGGRFDVEWVEQGDGLGTRGSRVKRCASAGQHSGLRSVLVLPELNGVFRGERKSWENDEHGSCYFCWRSAS